MPRFLNDGSQRPPRLLRGLHVACLCRLGDHSSWPGGWGREAADELRRHGVAIIQGSLGDEVDLPRIGAGRVDRPEDAQRLAREHAEAGLVATSLHLGGGFEDDAELDRLAAAVLDAEQATGHPLWVETHRATATQDAWRTLQLVRRFGELRFNADLSHWYTGLELVYGDFEAKLDRLQPVFERTCMLHGRIGNSCCMQVDIGDGSAPPQVIGRDFVADYRAMWTRVCAGFLGHAGPGDQLPFLPELIVPQGYYARAFPGPDG